MVVNLVNGQGGYLPLGRVRKGFPFAEPVSVAVARLFWNSLAKKWVESWIDEQKYIDRTYCRTNT